MLRQPCRAIAFETAALAEAERAGAWRIEVRDTDTGQLYTVTFAEFRQHAFELNRGWGAQLALRLEEWHTADPDPDVRQLTLWGARGH